ncbi:hypothetical protein PHPALM_27910 [Phytophthora palmivora]|uniref:Histone-lysine N-methyltransferase, H3 lysine-79 specific n=1 Tax=Phytophthora palmivora TaxID=4796 RepID=A0A2P4XBE6_9STRA|nr:hypothetical protein PHPALM_27910 [Phytophthora palmivora]
MADFSEADDRLIFQLAKQQLDEGHKIDWVWVWQGMVSSDKTQHQLQIRLRRLIARMGAIWTVFLGICAVERTGNEGSLPTNPATWRYARTAYRRDFPGGVTAILSALPRLRATDIFLDISSGIGNVVVQVCLETLVGLCLGVEVQQQLVGLSTSLITSAKPSFSRLNKVRVYEADMRQLYRTVKAAVESSNIVFSNNLAFDPPSNMALDSFVTRAPPLAHVITTSKLCGRHRDGYQRSFCLIWKLHQIIPVSVSWTAKSCNAYWYIKHYP